MSTRLSRIAAFALGTFALFAAGLVTACGTAAQDLGADDRRPVPSDPDAGEAPPSAPATEPPFRADAGAPRERLLLVGGEGFNTQFLAPGSVDDSWVFDGASWTELPDRLPMPIHSAAVARYDTQVLFFGGRNTNDFSMSTLGETYLWDARGWSQPRPEVSPGKRSDAAAATLDGRVVVFGGLQEQTFLADTWTWDGTAWKQLHPATSPSARSGAAVATLGARVVLVGGYGPSGYLDDAWTWDGTTWTKLVGSTPGPVAHATMVTRGSELVLFGGTVGPREPNARPSAVLGDTWVFDGALWTRKLVDGPSPRVGPAMGVLGDRVILFSGYLEEEGGDWEKRGDTWSWDGASWTKLSPEKSPYIRSSARMVAVPAPAR